MLAWPSPPVRKTGTPRGAGASATATGSDDRPGALPNGSSRTLSVPQLNPVTPGQAGHRSAQAPRRSRAARARRPVTALAGYPPLHPASAASSTAAAAPASAPPRLRPGLALAGARMFPASALVISARSRAEAIRPLDRGQHPGCRHSHRGHLRAAPRLRWPGPVTCANNGQEPSGPLTGCVLLRACWPY